MKTAALVTAVLLLAGCASLAPAPAPPPSVSASLSPQPPGYRRYTPPPRPSRIEVEPPRGWLSFGLHYAGEQGEVDEFLDDSAAFSIGAGGYLLRREQLALGPEIEGIFSDHNAQLTPTLDDDVVVSRFLLGARLALFLEDTNLAPYLRGGWMYRWDDGDFVEDEGSGYYVGGGLDVMVTPRFSIVPQILYTSADLSVDADEILFGIDFDYKF